MSIRDQLRYRLATFSIAEKIILANVIFFVLPMLLNVFFFLFRIQGQEYLNSLAWDKGKQPGEAEYNAALKAAKEGMGDEFSQEAFDARWNAKFFHPDRATTVSPTTKILTRGPY